MLPTVRPLNRLTTKVYLYALNITFFFVLKAYMRKHVAHDVQTALDHFGDLKPAIDKYGKKKTNKKTNLSGHY